MRNTGFTLLELVLVVAIIFIIFALSLPIGLEFYQNQQLDSTSQSIVQTLRRAQQKAMAMQGDSMFGIYVGTGKTGSYILFQGQSFNSRTSEEVFECPGSISFSGIPETAFSKLQGAPTATGNIVLTFGSKTRTININPVGRINLEQ